jgi:hypothetical protein
MPSGASPIVLSGPAMPGLIRAVGALERAAIGRYAVVGGIAVATRLGEAHRATIDVDAVVDDSPRGPSAVEALLALPDADPDPGGRTGVLVAGTKLELLEVGQLESGMLEGVPDNDALFASSHAWALQTASRLTITAASDRSASVTAWVATAPALVSMKLHAIEDRRGNSAVKRASDAWDLYRLLVDLDRDGWLRSALAAAPDPLPKLVRSATERIFVRGAARTRSWLLQGDAVMASVRADDLRLVAEPLVATLGAG